MLRSPEMRERNRLIGQLSRRDILKGLEKLRREAR